MRDEVSSVGRRSRRGRDTVLTDNTTEDRISSKAKSPKVVLRVGLLLDHRLGRLWGDYGVCMAMHYLPGAILGSKDHRNSQSAWSRILASANLDLIPLYHSNVGKLRSHILRYGFEADVLAIYELR